MKKSLVIILACTLCVLLFAAGCTGSSPAKTATPAATTKAPVTPPEIPATTAPASEALPWSGTWNTTWLERDGNLTVSVITLTQAGADVRGNYSYIYPKVGTFTGSLNATVVGNTATGTYFESDNDIGLFVFTLSENKNSFTGRWVHAANRSELANSTLTWNGVRQ